MTTFTTYARGQVSYCRICGDRVHRRYPSLGKGDVMNATRKIFIAAVIAAGAVLAGCGGQAPASVPPATTVVTVDPAADAAVQTMYLKVSDLVYLYRNAGVRVSVSEMNMIASAATSATDSVDAVGTWVARGAYSPGQSAALATMTDAGAKIARHMAVFDSDVEVQADWATYQQAYQDYQAAS